MATKLQIYNLAATLLNEPAVSDTNGSGTLEVTLSALYDVNRQALLEEVAWNFSIKRQSLTKDVDTPNSKFKYKYILPTDIIRIYNVYNDTNEREEEIDGYISSDSTSMKLVYVADITDSSKFPPLFSKILAYDMAIMAQRKIRNENTDTSYLYRERERLLKVAKKIDSMKNVRKHRRRSTIEDASYIPYGDI